jgi:hypothetical protein
MGPLLGGEMGHVGIQHEQRHGGELRHLGAMHAAAIGELEPGRHPVEGPEMLTPAPVSWIHFRCGAPREMGRGEDPADEDLGLGQHPLALLIGAAEADPHLPRDIGIALGDGGVVGLGAAHILIDRRGPLDQHSQHGKSSDDVKRRPPPARDGAASRTRSGRDDPDLLVGAFLDHEFADGPGDIAVLVELAGAGRTGIGDLLAGGDEVDRLLPVARTDDLSAGAADIAQRIADGLAVGGARFWMASAAMKVAS